MPIYTQESRMTRRLLPLLLLLPLAVPATAAGSERLSNERTLTRWAHTNLIGPIKRKPAHESRTIGELRWNTEDGLPEVYLVLRRQVDKLERVWLQIRVPGRPNGRTGWVREENLSNLKTVRTHLTVDRTKLKATLRKKGKVIWSSPIGVGAPGTPTPGGKFWIRERLRGDGAIYGPWAFGTAAYSGLSEWPGGGVIGIHGTNAPSLIPGRPSHGCIRVPNWNIVKLVRKMPIGTPLLIK
jgi:L,D-transpeptidase catalytic domain